MKAFVLAAGRGERMRPLTDNMPKPLLHVQGKTLLDHQVGRVAKAGIRNVVVNIAYLGDLIRNHIGDGKRYGIVTQVSTEPYPLETAGAICHAAPLLGDAPFLLVNSDVWCDYDVSRLVSKASLFPSLQRGGAHLVLVPNPEHNPSGDYGIEQGYLALSDGDLSDGDMARYTYSGIAIVSPELIQNYPERREAFPLKEVFDWGISQGIISAELYEGYWQDVGTPERLESLKQYLSDGKRAV